MAAAISASGAVAVADRTRGRLGGASPPAAASPGGCAAARAPPTPPPPPLPREMTTTDGAGWSAAPAPSCDGSTDELARARCCCRAGVELALPPPSPKPAAVVAARALALLRQWYLWNRPTPGWNVPANTLRRRRASRM